VTHSVGAKQNAEYARFYAVARRRQADQIYNLSLTRTATVILGRGMRRVIGVGRVKTPTLAIVCKRELEIRNFVPLAQPITLNIASNISAVGTARTRVGVAMNNWLFYGMGGAAVVKSSANGTSIAGVPCGTLGVIPNCSASAWRPGLAAGLGAEWGFAQNGTAKLEYLYIAVVGSGQQNPAQRRRYAGGFTFSVFLQ
jgi:opacity protein-like surface antigen